MAQVNSIKAGFINETGVMSATCTSATSALIKHAVMLPSSTVTYLNNVAFSTSTGPDGGTLTGCFGVASGKNATLILTKAAAATIVLSKVGGVIQVSGGASVPLGQNG